MSNRVTIQDIADELNLSRNTVSKALNNSEGLADATRQRILQKAIEMGYKQFGFLDPKPIFQRTDDPNGRLPLTDRREIAVLSTVYLAAPHFSSLMLDAFQSQVSRLGYTLNSHRVTLDDLASHALPLTFDPQRVAAIICFEMFNLSYDEMLCELGIPILFVDGPARLHGENLPADQLYMENTTQVMRLVSDMAARGVKRIGFVGNWEHCQSFFERYVAFRTAMDINGLEIDDHLCIKDNYIGVIESALAKLSEMPELFICANDLVALDTLQTLRGLGLSVPKDVMLAGFDDSAESRRSFPQLTTIHIHTQVMAISAVQMLRARMENPDLDFRQLYAETNLIYRASTERP